MKKTIWKKVIDLGVFALVLVLGFLYLNKVFGFQDNTHSRAAFKQFYEMPENVADVAWIGSSAVQEYIIPMQMYEEYGVTLLPLALGSMPFDATELLIKEVEKTQDPCLYLVDLRDLAFEPLADPGIRRVTDNMKLSKNRFDLIDKLTNDWQAFHPVGNLDRFDYYFSFMKYHSRWQDLQKTDFTDDENCFMGYWISTGTESFDKKQIMSYFDTEEKPIPEENVVFLNEFLDFCDGFGKKVVFTCTPNCLDEEYFAQFNFAKRIIRERGYEVWDMNDHVDEIGLDYATDFRGKLHVNTFGAEKVTHYVAQQLVEKYNLKDHRGEEKCRVYERYAELYHRKRNEAYLSLETDLDKYLDYLLELSDGTTIYMTTFGPQGAYLTDAHIEKLRKLGLVQAGGLKGEDYHSYLAIVSDGEVLHETIGVDNADSTYATYIGNTKVSMSSASWKGRYGCSIRLGVSERSLGENGINIVVVDKESGEVLDSVAFDTADPAVSCTRSGNN